MQLALRTTLSYLVFGALWILLSDYLLNKLITAPETISEIQKVKGLVFVALSALVLFLLVMLGERKRSASHLWSRWPLA